MIFSRRKYKFTDKHNAKTGIASAILGIISVLCEIETLNMAYKCRGNAGTMMGFIGTVGFAFATIGLLLGLSSFKEEDKFYAFSWFGTIVCAIVWLLMCAVIVIGM